MASIGIALSFCFNIYQYFYIRAYINPVLSFDTSSKISAIEKYLDQISPDYIDSVRTLAKEDGIQSWGCGPSSYALARIINSRFFDDKLPIYAAYNIDKRYQIVERFSFVDDPASDDPHQVGDHAWIEVYVGDRFLFIDPTIGQFGKYNKIMYQEFTLGDKNVSNVLLDKYGIMDIRFATLMHKIINRIPTDQEPYPGMTINPASMSYYVDVLEYRDLVNEGKEPDNWKSWVAILMKKFN